jgi:alpha-ketoglutarate-dependent taurine dioxygenase
MGAAISPAAPIGSRNRHVFWDNHSTKHLAVHDAGPFRRIMRRTQIVDDRVY